MNDKLIISENKNVLTAKNERAGVKGTLINEVDDYLLRSTVKAALLKAMASTNKDLESPDLTFLIEETKSELLRSFASIRIEEIGLAIHKGAIGEYGIVYNLSLNTIIGWIRTYITSEARIMAVKEVRKNVLALSIPIKPSDEEQQKTRVYIMVNAWEQYLKLEKYNDVNNTIFNLLCTREIITGETFTEADKRLLWKNAKDVLRARFTRVAQNMDERFENKRKLKEIHDDPDHPLINIEACQLGLMLFFKRCKENNVDLKTKIKPE